jgi:hypothetical protein
MPCSAAGCRRGASLRVRLSAFLRRARERKEAERKRSTQSTASSGPARLSSVTRFASCVGSLLLRRTVCETDGAPGGTDEPAPARHGRRRRQGCVLVLSFICIRPRTQLTLPSAVAFIDTEGTFRPDRVRSIAERFGVDPQAALENVVGAYRPSFRRKWDWHWTSG